MQRTRKLAEALERVKAIADQNGANIVQSIQISRQDRTLLIRTKWLQEITKGWYLFTRSDLAPGDSAAWYASFWDFLKIYLHNRYQKNYCLSADISLSLQIGETLIPRQVIVIVPHGGTILHLPFTTSILIYSDPENIPDEKIEFHGLQIMSLPYAICKVTPTFFSHQSETIEIALRTIRSPSDLSKILLKYHFMRAAERILGAYQFFGMPSEVRAIQNDLSSAGEIIKPENPFLKKNSIKNTEKFRSPYAARIKILWKKYRNTIIDIFPDPVGLIKNQNEYLDKVNEMYVYDAYNSLSIEGYHVTKELIEKVKNKNWNPDSNIMDATQKDVLAARGYYECFQVVKKTLIKILEHNSAAKWIKEDLSIWYQNLFAPCVRADIISATDLLGYRNDRVYIRNSRHVPPPKDAVIDSMEALFECLDEEEHAAIRAVLGHYFFVYIHPYMDGNGRIARFLLNAMFASGGYPWTVVRLSHRKEYINSLERTHTENNIDRFAKFILDEMKHSAKLFD